MFTIQKCAFMRILNGSVLNRRCSLFIATAIGLTFLLGAPPAFADNAVKLKVLVITIGDVTQDVGLAYIKPVLDDMGVPYDVLNASTQNLTTAMLSPASCSAAAVGCVGNYNGTILTNSDLGGNFTPTEWDILHNYETNFKVREAVLSGWPATYTDPNPGPLSGTIYLDYGLTYSSSPVAPFNATWTVPAPAAGTTGADNKSVFEYVNTLNPLSVTDFAFAANPRGGAMGPRDGTVPSVIPLLRTPAGEALVSIIKYTIPLQTTPSREVMFSSITNAWYLIHSQVLATELVNYATQGVFVGGRKVYMAAHLDDLFIADELWDTFTRTTNPLLTYRLNGADITNAVSKQTAFRAAHPTAGNTFKLDFPFNGSGAVLNPDSAILTPNLADGLVSAVVANKAQFRYINHTFEHKDMDNPPIPANAPCDYSTFTTVAAIEQEIVKNRTVWGLLSLPEQNVNNRILISGNHSGLKDRKCTDNDQSDDVAFEAGANPQFFTALANKGVSYIASDTSQTNQAAEQYASVVNDGGATNRLLLPRWPTNIFFNVTNWVQLVDEYNFIFHDRFVNAGQNPCIIPGAICATRNQAEILAAEADSALRHMLTFRKWPHFFHQTNVAKYDAAGNTLQFDWLNAVYTAYERLFKLPTKNLPYYLIGDNTQERLIAKSAIIQAKWDRTTNQVTLSANKTVPNLLVTGFQGGDLYGGQFVLETNINTTPKTVAVNRALTQ